MSIKSFIQILLLLLIASIVTVVYLKYFDVNENIVEEINSIELDNQEKINKLEKKISELELKNNELKIIIDKKNNEKDASSKDIKNKIVKNNEINSNLLDTNIKLEEKKKLPINKKDKIKETKIEEKKDLVKDIEYNSIDDKGNNFFLLAKSGKSNINNKNVLDLENVRGKITSDERDTIYIVSDYAEFNSVNSNSKFYYNVIINYQQRQITCENFDINMETGQAIAYNNVIVSDPNSNMKAGIVEFDLKTKNININPQSTNVDIKIVTN